MAGMATLPVVSQASTLNQWFWLNTTSTTSSTTNFNMFPIFSQTGSSTIWNSWNATPYTFMNGANLTNIQWEFLNARLDAKREIFETIPVASEEQQRRWRLQEMRRQAISRRRTRQRAAADTLAENLLLACMSPQQARDHLEKGWFDVESSHGRHFRIFTKTSPWGSAGGAGQSGNVVLLDAEGKQDARYCVHPPDGLPHADAWLAQKLALEADEDTVMAVANLPWQRAGHQDIRGAARERLRLIRSAA